MTSSDFQQGSNDDRESAGSLLRTAREKMELSLKDIATQLNLQSNIIQALEADDVNNLPVAAYVRGYIRSYARIVKLDPDTVISLYEGKEQKPPEILPDVKHHSQVSSSDKPVKAMTYLITFGLVLLLLAWWQSHFIVGKNLMTDLEDNTPNKGALSYTYDIVIHPDTPFLEDNTEGTELIIELPPYDPESDSTNMQFDNNTDEKDQKVEHPAVSKLATQIDNIGTGPDRLSLSFSEKSWVEVYDVNKKRIYMDTANPGDKLDLSGTAPFSVILGFSPGVKVIFNGKPFNQEPYTNAGIARFTLGE